MNAGRPRVIAIDGPAAAGKGTLARRLAAHLDYAYLDTGALYRAVAARLLAAGAAATPLAAAAEARRITAADLERDDLRGDHVAEVASQIAAMPEVRAELLAFQRGFATHPPGGRAGAVLDGRDIATVVCPDADWKLFVTAAVEVRALRRLKELRDRGLEAIHSRVLREMQERDARDSKRRVAPLVPARDAVVIDTSTLDAEDAFAAALEIVEARKPRAQAWPSTYGSTAAGGFRLGARAGLPGAGLRRFRGALSGVADAPHLASIFANHIQDRRNTQRMTDLAVAEQQRASGKESFAALLDQSMNEEEGFEGRVVQGTVVAIENDMAVIDVGLKSEGRVSLKEFGAPGQPAQIAPGDTVDVFVERYEDRDGMVMLSREKARREEAWNVLEKAFKNGERITGTIFGRVKGGFIVDLSGAVAFLPGSQVDIRPVRDISPLMNTPQPFQILKMDRSRNNIVVSRRAVLEETRAEARSELIANLKEGQVLEGVVKNITDYGAFVDLGGVDGLLHVTDISWKRINHPSEALQIGETVRVQVIRFNPETQRISLGMKQLEADPWDGVELKYPKGAKFRGRVTNITDYGAFIELEPGVEGLVHVSEMSWTKKNVHPGKIVSTSQEVEVVVLDVDKDKRRISLGLKQCLANPWEDFLEKHPIGSVVEGEIKNTTEFGLFIGLPGDIDGMVHLSDLSWSRSGEEILNEQRKGEIIRAKVLDVDVDKERISLGVKQLEDDPFAATAGKLKKGDVVTCTVTAILDNGIEVQVGDGLTGLIRKAELSRDRSEQRPDRFAPGEKLDAKITQIDQAARRVSLSIRARELDDEKKAVATYGSSDSGASLGEILGAAIKEKRESALRAAEQKRAASRAGKSDGDDDGDRDGDDDS